MPSLETGRIAEILEPFCPEPSAALLDRLSVYLDLLLKWNARTNLTAIRTPEEMVRRHFGESLFLASQLVRHAPDAMTLLDLGSGAGFPGIPVQLSLPGLQVTLAESQNKKAAFLREVARTLGLKTTVWADRAENLAEGTVFDVVAMRAVDNPGEARTLAGTLVSHSGVIAHLGGPVDTRGVVIPIPGSLHTVLQLFRPHV